VGKDVLLCSDCLEDVGLRIEAEKVGFNDESACPRCSSIHGRKLGSEEAEDLVLNFFWNGSFRRYQFGGANRIASNPYRFGNSDIVFPGWLDADAKLIQSLLKIGLFHYGPRLWRLGHIEPLQKLRLKRSRSKTARQLVAEFPSLTIDKGFLFHRLRTDVAAGQEAKEAEYDAPPDRFLGNGRLDAAGFPVLYGSQNIEICFHECKVTLPQECFFAHLEPTRPLKILDMRAEIENDGPTEFESKNLALHYLFSADSISYELTRALAQAAWKAKYDGMLYPSYFSSWKPQKIFNIAIFGRPLQDGRLRVRSINRAYLTRASYEFTFGPLFE
jgi:hypothetical protein